MDGLTAIRTIREMEARGETTVRQTGESVFFFSSFSSRRADRLLPPSSSLRSHRKRSARSDRSSSRVGDGRCYSEGQFSVGATGERRDFSSLSSLADSDALARFFTALQNRRSSSQAETPGSIEGADESPSISPLRFGFPLFLSLSLLPLSLTHGRRSYIRSAQLFILLLISAYITSLLFPTVSRWLLSLVLPFRCDALFVRSSPRFLSVAELKKKKAGRNRYIFTSLLGPLSSISTTRASSEL